MDKVILPLGVRDYGEKQNSAEPERIVDFWDQESEASPPPLTTQLCVAETILRVELPGHVED